MVVQHRYKKVTHKVSKDLAEYILRSLKDSDGNPEFMTVFVVYTHKRERRVLLTTWGQDTNEEVRSSGYVSLLDTSGINQLVSNTPTLQFKTNLEEYLYKALKREEKVIEDVKKQMRR